MQRAWTTVVMETMQCATIATVLEALVIILVMTTAHWATELICGEYK